MVHKSISVLILSLSFAVNAYALNCVDNAWGKQINDASRFIVLSQFNNEAVLDMETCLVWEQSPAGMEHFHGSAWHCHTTVIGGRLGWRSPTVEELSSLVDPAQASSPKLPANHPFNFPADSYWSITSAYKRSDTGWIVDFNNATVDHAYKTDVKRVICVRGGYGHDGVAGM